MSNTTRERIVDEAMRLFSERGYASTSISTIEAAAGLSPGTGSLYHHFDSKQALLTAGIERQLARLEALRGIRRVLGPLGDPRAELTLMARYVLAELDSESELLRILASQARSHPELMARAVQELMSFTLDGFTSWIGERAGNSADDETGSAIASIGFEALLCNRILSHVYGVPERFDDEVLVEAWVQLMMRSVVDPAS